MFYIFFKYTVLINIRETFNKWRISHILFLQKKKWSKGSLDYSVSIGTFSFGYIEVHHRIMLRTGTPSLLDIGLIKIFLIGQQSTATSISLFEKHFKLIVYFNGHILKISIHIYFETWWNSFQGCFIYNPISSDKKFWRPI